MFLLALIGSQRVKFLLENELDKNQGFNQGLKTDQNRPETDTFRHKSDRFWE